MSQLVLANHRVLHSGMADYYVAANTYAQNVNRDDYTESQMLSVQTIKGIFGYTKDLRNQISIMLGRDEEGNPLQVKKLDINKLLDVHDGTTDVNEFLTQEPVVIPRRELSFPDEDRRGIDLSNYQPYEMKPIPSRILAAVGKVFIFTRNEAIRCQSAKIRSGMLPQDATRFRNHCFHIEELLTIHLNTPITDEPNSDDERLAPTDVPGAQAQSG